MRTASAITLNCPNDRYINDEAICQAVTPACWASIGIKVTLDSKPKAQHFPLIKKKETDFYMLGWGVPTFDSRVHLQLPGPHDDRQARLLERDALFQPGPRQEDRGAGLRNGSGKTRQDDRRDLGRSAEQVLYAAIHHQV